MSSLFGYNQIKYFCSTDGSELVDLYNPEIDEEILVNLPKDYDDFSQFDKDAIATRRDTLIEFISKVSQEKQKRLNTIITQQSAIILICPRCKKIFDSASIVMKEKTHGDDNIIPYKKPKEHKVISDDKESFDEATSSPFDQSFMASRQIFFAQPKEDLLKKNISNHTKFKDSQELKSLDKLPYLKQQMKRMMEKYGESNVSINIQLGDN